MLVNGLGKVVHCTNMSMYTAIQTDITVTIFKVAVYCIVGF